MIKMTNSAGSTSSEEPRFHSTSVSITPIPQAARKMTAKLSIRPITAAVSARRSIEGPKADPSGRPIIPARRIKEVAASSAESPHATLWVRPTLMPSRDARSELSALARSAMPMAVNRRNAHSPPTTRSVASTAISSLAWNT